MTLSLIISIYMVKYTLSALLFILLGGAIVFGYYALQQEDVERCTAMFPLTSSDLDCEEYAESRDRMKNLNTQLTELAGQLENSVEISDISVWVRDLTTRQWAAYNEHKTYAPASLMKLPFLITYHKVAEVDPAVMQARITYQALDENDGHVVPEKILTLGTEYSVEELLSQMIRYSDNNAMRALVGNLPPDIINNTLTDLGLQIVNGSETFDFVTAKTYANIFRILYNASYLDRAHSEQVLNLLTTSAYPGMAKLLPPTVKVAHKFGEREVVDESNTMKTLQLHDCGIVYKKLHPYSLCVMTRGTSFTAQQNAIEQISKLVYDAM